MKYEYKVVVLENPFEWVLNEYGELGWKLVSVIAPTGGGGVLRAVFMREKVERMFLKD